MLEDFFDDSNAGRNVSAQARAARPSIPSLTRDDRTRITRMMQRAIEDMERHYAVEKASLALYDHTRDKLCITHLYLNGTFKTSLTLILPDQHSLLYQIYDQGFPVADNYPSLLASTVIEKKILMGPNTRSVLIVPLIHEGIRLGVLSLASADSAAFSTYLEGVGEKALICFAAALNAVILEAAAAGESG